MSLCVPSPLFFPFISHLAGARPRPCPWPASPDPAALGVTPARRDGGGAAGVAVVAAAAVAVAWVAPNRRRMAACQKKKGMGREPSSLVRGAQEVAMSRRKRRRTAGATQTLPGGGATDAPQNKKCNAPGDVPHLLPRKLRLRHAIHVAVWRARCTTKRHTSTVAGGGGHVATRKRPSGRHHAARRHAAVHGHAVRCSRKDMRVGAIARRGVGGGTWKRRVAERDCGDAGRHWLRRRLG